MIVRRPATILLALASLSFAADDLAPLSDEFEDASTTTEAVWPPAAFGSDYVENTENYIFLSYGTAQDAGTRQFEIKATRNSISDLYWASTGIDQNETEAWLQMVRVGDTVVCLRKHSLEGDWIVENRYPNPDHPFPDFGPTLQVGITAYTDWDTAEDAADDPAESYHFNYAPPSDGSPDLISQVDYFRFRRPDPALTASVLQAMRVSYDPAIDTTIDPPVLLAASPAASPYLGENANLAFDPYGDWREAQFGDDAALPHAEPGEDPDHDSLANLLECVLGGLPLEESSDVLPVLTVADGMLSYSFTPVLDCGVLLEVEFSQHLDDWTAVAFRPLVGGPWNLTGPGVSVEADETSGEVTVSFPVTAPSSFIRLAASLQ